MKQVMYHGRVWEIGNRAHRGWVSRRRLGWADTGSVCSGRCYVHTVLVLIVFFVWGYDASEGYSDDTSQLVFLFSHSFFNSRKHWEN